MPRIRLFTLAVVPLTLFTLALYLVGLGCSESDEGDAADPIACFKFCETLLTCDENASFNCDVDCQSPEETFPERYPRFCCHNQCTCEDFINCVAKMTECTTDPQCEGEPDGDEESVTECDPACDEGKICVGGECVDEPVADGDEDETDTDEIETITSEYRYIKIEDLTGEEDIDFCKSGTSGVDIDAVEISRLGPNDRPTSSYAAGCASIFEGISYTLRDDGDSCYSDCDNIECVDGGCVDSQYSDCELALGAPENPCDIFLEENCWGETPYVYVMGCSPGAVVFEMEAYILPDDWIKVYEVHPDTPQNPAPGGTPEDNYAVWVCKDAFGEDCLFLECGHGLIETKVFCLEAEEGCTSTTQLPERCNSL